MQSVDMPPVTSVDMALGVDLGGTKIEAMALDGQGRTLARERAPTPAGDYVGTLLAVQALVARVEGIAGRRAQRIGVGTPGSQAADGRIKNSNSVCLNGQPLAQDLAQRLGRPVRLANDANCLALSEATDGAGAGAEVLFAAILGTGTGAGVVVNGQLLTGANGLAGEWGHNPLPWPHAEEVPGTVCYCGHLGCIETWLSGPGMASDHLRHGGAALSARQIAEGAAAADPACEATLARYEHRLARALAQVINLLDPQVVVLGGGLSNIERLYTTVPRLWDRYIFGAGVREPVRTRLARSRHGDSSGVRGAAWLWSGSPLRPAGG
jgi:fructokinase